MQVVSSVLRFSTKGHTDIVNITASVIDQLQQSGLREGAATISAIGSTTGITTLEFEPGLVGTDVAQCLDLIAPYTKPYAHNATWGDDNGAAHLRSALVGTSQTIPFIDGQLILGTWQQIVFMDFDTRPRQREVIVQLMGK
ncbi:MAG: secondary thiamine-phosphate synthase enzyme YjbQ [Saprospiraceae bacterium]|nr:secondary thiamine-phosphate synthase enzyme YjbQ [Saprospiraceae bacterium]